MPPNVAIAAKRINDELNRRPGEPMSISSRARAKLELLQTEYLADVAQDAIRAARKHELATADESHVNAAAARIGSGAGGPSPFASVANTLGGVFAGAALASTYAIMFTEDKHGTTEIVTAIALSIFGFSLLAIGLTMTFIKRA